jgi:hypothetical protein
VATASSDIVVKVTGITEAGIQPIAVIEPKASNRLIAIKISADGKRLAIATARDRGEEEDTSYPVSVWKVSPARQIMEAFGGTFELNPDGSRIASGRFRGFASRRMGWR